ncbi:MAG: hypothetical protein KC550_06785 [Nanoarchaeota archaeon]|nr:hypothetical protein [Nanoarchaeota archaeon]
MKTKLETKTISVASNYGSIDNFKYDNMSVLVQRKQGVRNEVLVNTGTNVLGYDIGFRVKYSFGVPFQKLGVIPEEEFQGLEKALRNNGYPKPINFV